MRENRDRTQPQSLPIVLGRKARRVAIFATCLALSGCMALRLANRGAPQSEVLELELALDPIDLPPHMGHHEAGVLP